MTEEPFAPVMPLLDFSKIDDVIRAANNTATAWRPTCSPTTLDGLEDGGGAAKDVRRAANVRCRYAGLGQNQTGPSDAGGVEEMQVAKAARRNRKTESVAGDRNAGVAWTSDGIVNNNLGVVNASACAAAAHTANTIPNTHAFIEVLTGGLLKNRIRY